MAAGITACFLQPALAAPGDLVGGPVVIGDTQDSFNTRTSVASDGAGNLVATWVDASGNVLARRFTSSGAPIGDPIQIAPASSGMLRAPSVAANASGQFTIAWLSIGKYGPPHRFQRTATQATVHARTFSADGAPNVADVQIANAGPYDSYLSSASVAMDDDGDFVVGWATNNTSVGVPGPYASTCVGENQALYARAYNAAGTPRTSLLTLSQKWSHTCNLVDNLAFLAPKVGMDGVGNFTVLWSNIDELSSGMPSSRPVFVRSYSADGVAKGKAVKVTTPSTMNQPAVLAENRNGQYTVAWGDYSSTSANGLDVYARSYKPGDVPASDTVLATSDLQAQSQMPAVAIDATGNFAVGAISGTFEAQHPVQISLRLFAPDGTPLSASTTIPVDTYNATVAVALGASGTGDAVYVNVPTAGSTTDQVLLQAFSAQ
jgi:hypothetical protein